MKISIALCTFNGEKYIKKQLESYLNQTYPPNELIICDDGSTDLTVSILEDFQEKAPFPVRIYINNPNLGVRENFAKVISLCSGDIIFLSDQDDVWLPRKIEVYSNFFLQNPDCILLFSNAYLIDENGNRNENLLWDHLEFDEKNILLWLDNINALKSLMMGRTYVTGATIAFKSTLKERALPFPNLQQLGWWHDGWLALIAAAQNGLYFISDVLIEYRLHQGQQLGLGNGVSVINNTTILSRSKMYLKYAIFSYAFARNASDLINVSSRLKKYLLANIWYWRIKMVTRSVSGFVALLTRRE